MKKLLVLIVILAYWSTLSAQRSDQQELQMGNLYQGESLDVFDLRPRALEGSLYFSDDWLSGSVKLSNDKVLNDYPMRYNLEAGALEVQVKGNVLALPVTQIEEFTLQTADSQDQFTFKAASAYPGTKSTGPSLFQVLSQGHYSLLVGYTVEVFRANYVPALDAGSLNPKAVRKEVYYLNDGNSTLEIPHGKKKARDFFAAIHAEAESFIRSENIRFKSVDDYQRVVDFCNEHL